jgi:hypothetical protein
MHMNESVMEKKARRIMKALIKHFVHVVVAARRAAQLTESLN